MGIKIMEQVFLHPAESHTQQGVLIVLAWHANNDTGTCWPSVPTIASESGLCERTVRSALDALVQAHRISRDERRGRSSIYHVTPLHPMQGCATCTPASPASTPAPDVAPPLHPLPTTPVSHAPITVIEQSFGTVKQPSHVPSSASERRAHEEQFDRFWKEYPRKVGKAEARRVWLDLRPNDALFRAILSAVAVASKSDPWMDEDRFIPHAAKWLKDERWTDELPNSPAPPLGHVDHPGPHFTWGSDPATGAECSGCVEARKKSA